MQKEIYEFTVHIKNIFLFLFFYHWRNCFQGKGWNGSAKRLNGDVEVARERGFSRFDASTPAHIPSFFLFPALLVWWMFRYRSAMLKPPMPKVVITAVYHADIFIIRQGHRWHFLSCIITCKTEQIPRIIHNYILWKWNICFNSKNKYFMKKKK